MGRKEESLPEALETPAQDLESRQSFDLAFHPLDATETIISEGRGRLLEARASSVFGLMRGKGWGPNRVVGSPLSSRGPYPLSPRSYLGGQWFLRECSSELG